MKSNISIDLTIIIYWQCKNSLHQLFIINKILHFHIMEPDINVSFNFIAIILWYRGYQKMVDLGLLDFTVDVWTKCYNGE